MMGQENRLRNAVTLFRSYHALRIALAEMKNVVGIKRTATAANHPECRSTAPMSVLVF